MQKNDRFNRIVAKISDGFRTQFYLFSLNWPLRSHFRYQLAEIIFSFAGISVIFFCKIENILCKKTMLIASLREFQEAIDE
jgi:hypothetical protein